MKLRAKFESGSPAAEQAKSTTDESVSPAARNLALAHRLGRLIDQGLDADYTAAARLLGVSQPRLTHLMSLLLLAPTVQEAILAGTLAPADKKLRRLARMAEWQAQVASLSKG
jgi:predicted XRE-type DNA-binding protein